MKMDDFYMDVACRISEESYAERLKVGAVIVTENGAMYPGFNGTLPGFPNKCETEENTTDENITVHAEQNALYKMLKEGVSANGATIFVTHSPCAQCCKMMVAVGIKRVVFKQKYREVAHLGVLDWAGVQLCHLQT